jgi:hypothetical protein
VATCRPPGALSRVLTPVTAPGHTRPGAVGVSGDGSCRASGPRRGPRREDAAAHRKPGGRSLVAVSSGGRQSHVTGPLRPRATPQGHRHACTCRSAWVEGVTHVSTRVSPCRYVHSWVHSWGQTHTAVVTAVAVQSHASRSVHFPRSAQSGSVPSLHTRWTTLGVERQVDLWTKRSSVHSVGGRPQRPRQRPPSPGRGRGPRVVHRRSGHPAERQRQRIDMIRPATMAPNPIAKFQADSETMIGMRSPAT